MIGTFQLYLKEKPLQKKCHIIPKFFQKNLNKSDKFRGATIINGNWKIRQDHFYAKFIFCPDCNNGVFNKLSEHPISIDYLKTSNPYFENDEAMMRLAISICFRATLATQSISKNNDLIGAIRSWRQWLNNNNPTPLLYRVGALTYDRDNNLNQ